MPILCIHLIKGFKRPAKKSDYLGTLERSLVGLLVGLQMSLQVALGGELLLAELALERLLLGVHALVGGQVGAIAECLVTEATAKLFLQPGLGRVVAVGEMHRQMAPRLEAFGTNVAHKLPPLKQHLSCKANNCLKQFYIPAIKLFLRKYATQMLQA